MLLGENGCKLGFLGFKDTNLILTLTKSTFNSKKNYKLKMSCLTKQDVMSSVNIEKIYYGK